MTIRTNKVDSKRVARRLGRTACEALYRQLLLIRHFEGKVHEAFQEGHIYGTTHLCQGHEAVSVGAVSALRENDSLTYTYRGHGHVIARGMSLEAAFAEVLGRETGCSRGLGGSMHLADLEKGLLGSFAIVGAGLPVATGAAISAQLDGGGDVAMTFFGDGASNIGTFHEALNLASVWKLPVVFICENNLYGEYSPILWTTPFEDIARRADSYDMPGEIVDGNDLFAVREVVDRAVARARAGDGPSLVECKTYRLVGHSRSDPAKYRPEGELDAWKARDPILNAERLLAEVWKVSAAELEAIKSGVLDQIKSEFERALEGPFPEVRPLHFETLSPTVA